MSPTWTKHCKPVMQLLIQYLLLPLLVQWFPSFQYSLNDWGLFSYSFLLYGQTSKKVLQPLIWWISSRSCIYYWVKMSNVFYLRLLWCKKFFQVATKCANSYRFLKHMSPLQTLKTPIKHLLVNKISVNSVLIR